MILRGAALFAALALVSATAFADDSPAGPVPSEPAPPAATATVAAAAADILLPPEPSATATTQAPAVPTPVPLSPTAKPTASAAAPAPSARARSDDLNTPMEVGLAIFTLSYLPCLVIGVADARNGSIPLVLPVAGPLITASQVKLKDKGWGWAFFGSLSSLHAIGMGVFTFGALLPRDPAARRGAPPPRSATFRAAPVLGPGTWGMSLQGSF